MQLRASSYGRGPSPLFLGAPTIDFDVWIEAHGPNQGVGAGIRSRQSPRRISDGDADLRQQGQLIWSEIHSNG